MRHKWLELAQWHNKQDGATEKGNGSGSVNSAGTSNAKSEKVNRAPELAPPPEKIYAEPAGKGIPSFHVELLPMEDIYRVNGVMSPRKGYSINKVVEMLRNKHVRGLSREMKGAEVLMALDAAGIPMDDVLRDAKARQNALDFYEVEQKKQFEAEWARKVEENRQIQAELERVKAHYIARMSRNLDGVAREKARFSTWLTTKQQEVQSMLEAAELCAKATASEPASEPVAEVSLAEAGAKPV
jgi:hypothetical protein